MLPNATLNHLANIQNGMQKIYHQNVSWKDDSFWNDLQNPRKDVVSNSEPSNQTENLPTFIKTTKNCAKLPKSNIIRAHFKNESATNNVILYRRIFVTWRNYIKNKKDHRELLKQQKEQKERLDTFLKTLKRYQAQIHKFQGRKIPIRLQCGQGNQNTVLSKEKEKQSDTKSSESVIKNKTLDSSCYQHRFKAQQCIIQLQKEKLMKQDKIIQELKLGKLSKEINQSLEETQKEIQEALTKCSARVKCKVGPIQLENTEDDLFNFHVNSSKVPKIVQHTEKRAHEREQRRQIILERKKVIDQKRKEAIEMEIERKKVQDEEERKKNLEAMKERRKQELEIQQQVQAKKQRFLENCMKADNFYKCKLTRWAFEGFLNLIIIKKRNYIKSQEFYKVHLERKGFNRWVKFISETDLAKICKADQFYNVNLKNKMLKLWVDAYVLSIQHLQVAEDLYELRLQSKTFIHWYRYTCIQYVQQNKNLQRAQQHYNNRIIFHCFYQWKSLPAVILLEKAKEEKKRRWREKVWEVLPDYQPDVGD